MLYLPYISKLQRSLLNSHADTCCAGSNKAVLELKEEKVNVFPFSDDYAAVQDVPIASVAMGWKNRKNGELWRLVFHEALYFGNGLKESLLCPNQMQAAGIKIKDVPIQFDALSSHLIKVNGTLDIPLEMHGIISHLKTRLPTSEELELYWAGQFQSIELTEDTPWEPYSEKFAEPEGAARAAWRVSAMQVTFPRPNEGNHLDEAEEEDENTSLLPQRFWNPVKEAHCIAFASRWAMSRDAIKLAEEEPWLRG
jgi:hypothetical protein